MMVTNDNDGKLGTKSDATLSAPRPFVLQLMTFHLDYGNMILLVRLPTSSCLLTQSILSDSLPKTYLNA